MLFFSYNDEQDRRRSIFEVDINGQPANQDDDDAPTDYTAGDDAGAEDTGAPANADDAPTPNPNPAAPQAAQQDDTNPTDNPEDYTLPDNEDQGDAPPEGGMDTRMNTPAPAAAPTTGEGGGDAAPTDYTAGGDTGGDMGGDAGGDPGAGGDASAEGGEGAPTDYTAGGGDVGADPNAGGGEGGDPAAGGAEGGDPGAEGGGDPGADAGGADDDMGGDDNTGSSDSDDYNQQIQDLDKDLYADLSEPQMDIRNKELKRNFASLYDMIQDIIERINDISKDTASVKPLEFVTNKLNDLADRVSDYLVYTYQTKSYTENEVNYNVFLVAVNQINDIIAKIAPTHQ